MKVSVPLYAAGALAHVLHDAEVNAVLMERTGPGWILEFIGPTDKQSLQVALAKIGATIIESKRER